MNVQTLGHKCGGLGLRMEHALALKSYVHTDEPIIRGNLTYIKQIIAVEELLPLKPTHSAVDSFLQPLGNNPWREGRSHGLR